ncbi:hypothetical protein SAMN05660662_3448 [Blastococcus aurantiacus]|uniref:Uncharacterized protein n=1 Tax=Blastococcus aurantiacus TaxID=1550231 RepID=A0A1G7P431_9ACTN|nr:hypothetical protein [Blastococcus aurantiacus]SDF81058.1 hypothetical protein SAMN05660662_3448 [Blastococcus aurantiacus]
MTGRTRLRRWSTGSAAVLLAAGLAACGSDDDGGGDTAAGGTSAAESGADPAEFCEAAVDLEAGFSSGPGPDESAPPEEQQAALEEFSATMEPLLAEVEETAPEDISEDVETAAGLVREGISGNDPSVLESAEFQEADDAIDEYMLGECGYEQIEATGVDYEYEGLPDTVPAGVVAVTFTNEGEEVHEIGIARVNDDVTEPVEQLLTLPEEEVFSKLQVMGVTFASPGESETTFLRMDEGRYGAACFIPEGTTHMEAMGSGAPHFTLGMFAEFTAE